MTIHADPRTAALTGGAAGLLRRFNEAAMAGPTLDPADLAQAFGGVVALVEGLPNALRHLSGHLVSAQRRGALVDPEGRDTDEVAERVRQRCHDVAEALPALAVRLREARALVVGLAAAEIRAAVPSAVQAGFGSAGAPGAPPAGGSFG